MATPSRPVHSRRALHGVALPASCKLRDASAQQRGALAPASCWWRQLFLPLSFSSAALTAYHMHHRPLATLLALSPRSRGSSPTSPLFSRIASSAAPLALARYVSRTTGGIMIRRAAKTLRRKTTVRGSAEHARIAFLSGGCATLFPTASRFFFNLRAKHQRGTCAGGANWTRFRH